MGVNAKAQGSVTVEFKGSDQISAIYNEVEHRNAELAREAKRAGAEMNKAGTYSARLAGNIKKTGKSAQEAAAKVALITGGVLGAYHAARKLYVVLEEGAEALESKAMVANTTGAAKAVDQLRKGLRGTLDDTSIEKLAVLFGRAKVDAKDMALVSEYALTEMQRSGVEAKTVLEAVAKAIKKNEWGELATYGIYARNASEGFDQMRSAVEQLGPAIDGSARIPMQQLTTDLDNWMSYVKELYALEIFSLVRGQEAADIAQGMDADLAHAKAQMTQIGDMRREAEGFANNPLFSPTTREDARRKLVELEGQEAAQQEKIWSMRHRLTGVMADEHAILKAMKQEHADLSREASRLNDSYSESANTWQVQERSAEVVGRLLSDQLALERDIAAMAEERAVWQEEAATSDDKTRRMLEAQIVASENVTSEYGQQLEFIDKQVLALRSAQNHTKMIAGWAEDAKISYAAAAEIIAAMESTEGPLRPETIQKIQKRYRSTRPRGGRRPKDKDEKQDAFVAFSADDEDELKEMYRDSMMELESLAEETRARHLEQQAEYQERRAELREQELERLRSYQMDNAEIWAAINGDFAHSQSEYAKTAAALAGGASMVFQALGDKRGVGGALDAADQLFGGLFKKERDYMIFRAAVSGAKAIEAAADMQWWRAAQYVAAAAAYGVVASGAGSGSHSSADSAGSNPTFAGYQTETQQSSVVHNHIHIDGTYVDAGDSTSFIGNLVAEAERQGHYSPGSSGSAM